MSGRIPDTMLTVLGRAENTKAGSAQWHVRCDCGRAFVAVGGRMRNGHTTTCGCKATPAQRSGALHCLPRRARTYPENTVWQGMIARCHRPDTPAFATYGGRGIEVCCRWRDSFENFLADMGERPSPKHTIDRIDNDGNYEPGNCRWATRVEQANNKSDNVCITRDGVTKTVAEWCRELGLKPFTVYSRLSAYGLSPEMALSKGRVTQTTARMITCDGETLPLIEWARRSGLRSDTIAGRLDRGWSAEDALRRPVDVRRRRRDRVAA